MISHSQQREKSKKYSGNIENKAKLKHDTLNDLLSMNHMKTGKVTYEFSTFPLSKVLNEVVYDANMLLKDGQRINYPSSIDDYSIEFDEKVIELILSNLIHNAIKYSGYKTIIDLQVSSENNYLIFKIIDQGIGIPREEQKFIFETYFRAKNALFNLGKGLGLSIVKNHIENLGGSITFSSIENVGTTFIFQIPMISNHQK